jgi:signal transduction histidine kinase
VGVWVDVSHLYRLQREAVEAERTHRLEAEHSRKLQEQFIDITCHELRNPLNAIFNSASLLSESLAKIDARLVGAATHTPEASDMEEIHTEMRDNIDVVNTIVLCTTHQKRITDGAASVHALSRMRFPG